MFAVNVEVDKYVKQNRWRLIMFKVIIAIIVLLVASDLKAANFLERNVDIKEQNDIIDNTTDISILNQASFAQTKDSKKISIQPISLQVALTPNTYLPFLIFNSVRIGGDRKLDDIKADLLEPESALVNLMVGYDWQFTEYQDEKGNPILDYGTHLFPFLSGKHVEGVKINNQDFNDFQQYSAGLKIYSRLPLLKKEAVNIEEINRVGVLEIGIIGVGNYIGDKEYKNIMGDSAKRFFFNSKAYLTVFINNVLSLTAGGTVATTDSLLESRAGFSINLVKP